MRYNEFKAYFVKNIYYSYIDGHKGMARSAIANIYNNGKTNPRSTIYRMYSCLDEASILYEKQDAFYRRTNQPARRDKLQEAYFSLIKDTLSPEHRMVKKARDEMYDSYYNMYPSKKTQKYTNFVILKQKYPILKNMKFLAKIL